MGQIVTATFLFKILKTKSTIRWLRLLTSNLQVVLCRLKNWIFQVVISSVRKTLCNIAFAAHIKHLNVCFNFEKQIFLDKSRPFFTLNSPWISKSPDNIFIRCKLPEFSHFTLLTCWKILKCLVINLLCNLQIWQSRND